MRWIASSIGSLTLELTSEAETEELGQAIAAKVTPGVVIGLIGTLGAGKTRLSRAIAEALGVDPSAIASPTYVLIHEYDGSIPVYHFDTYRLDSPEAFEALGASEYWTRADGLCLIEWADRVLDLLPPETWLIHLDVVGDLERRATLTVPGQEAINDWLELGGIASPSSSE